jgi:hypothetical protein
VQRDLLSVEAGCAPSEDDPIYHLEPQLAKVSTVLALDFRR